MRNSMRRPAFAIVIALAIGFGSVNAWADALVRPPAWAVSYVNHLGFRPNGTRSWDPTSQLHVVTATYRGSNDGYYQRAFIFLGGRYLGTDTKNGDATVQLVWQTGLTFALRYPIYRQSDPNCCPHGSAVVRFHWTGSRLIPLDRIPPDSARR